MRLGHVGILIAIELLVCCSTSTVPHPYRLRKCCAGGQVARYARENQCADHPAGPTVNSTVELQRLFALHENKSEQYQIDAGFPRNCTVTDANFLEPDQFPIVKFYPLVSGPLIIPHRFQLSRWDDYCVDYFFGDDDQVGKVAKALACLNMESLPESAINGHGELQFDFTGAHVKSSTLSDLVGRRVVNKCCGFGQIMDDNKCSVRPNLSTLFFHKKEENNFLIRIAPLKCSDRRFAQFHEMTPSGRIRVADSNEGNFTEFANYCIDDTAVYVMGKLPSIRSTAYVCPLANQSQSDLKRVKDENSFEKPTNLKTLKSASPPSHALPEMFAAPSADLDLLKPVVQIPKCCPHGFSLIHGVCSPLPYHNSAQIVAAQVIQSLDVFFGDDNSSVRLLSNGSTSMPCGFNSSIDFNVNFENYIRPYFYLKPSETNDSYDLVFQMHYHRLSNWNYNMTVNRFCVDLMWSLKHFSYSYEPITAFCHSIPEVSPHYPILHSVSAVALFVVFVIYFYIPASSASRLTSGGRSQKRKTTKASTVNGQCLVCYAVSLFVWFVTLTLSQQGLFPPASTSCLCIGYVVYGSSVASFAWLSVYCFDYCRMFTGSFKVSGNTLIIPYSMFGWGYPFVVLLVAALDQFLGDTLGFPAESNPNMGLTHCWFTGQRSLLVHYYIPVGILMLLNVAFFLTLVLNPNVMKCRRKNRGPELRTNQGINKEKSGASASTEDAQMAVKLFFITGIPWVIEIAAWLPYYLDVDAELRRWLDHFFFVVNSINSLRGIILLVVVLSAKDARRYFSPRIEKILPSVVPWSKNATHSSSGANGLGGTVSRPTNTTLLDSTSK